MTRADVEAVEKEAFALCLKVCSGRVGSCICEKSDGNDRPRA